MGLSVSETIDMQLCALLILLSGTVESHRTLFNLGIYKRMLIILHLSLKPLAIFPDATVRLLL